MSANYDVAVSEHYDRVAEESGTSHASTMADKIIRAKETESILKFLRCCGKDAAVVVDVGCGNGYTLKKAAEALPQNIYTGVEYNDKLRELAGMQLQAFPKIRVMPGDLRRPESIAFALASADMLICQRVLINLLDTDDQRKGLNTAVALVKKGGVLLFIEAFATGLENLNKARAEFDLDPIPPAVHNQYVADDFFVRGDLRELATDEFPVPYNLLSTHYFVSRVLHEVVSEKFVRNSHFVHFFSKALPDAIGDYSPLRIKAFRKV